MTFIDHLFRLLPSLTSADSDTIYRISGFFLIWLAMVCQYFIS